LTSTITAFQIRGNYIGTNAAGVAALGNTAAGIVFTGNASNNVIENNTVAFNGGAGLRIVGGIGNRILLNSIHENGGLGIDLGSPGVTANGGAGETDLIQNFPTLTTAQNGASGTRVQGSLISSLSSTFELRFFVSPTCDPSGYGEGALQIGSRTVSTSSDGVGNFDQTFTPTVPLGYAVTATARNMVTSNTSEFSNCATVQQTPPPADPAQLSFVQQPTNADVGIPITPAVVVEVKDQSGTLLAGTPVSITLEPIVPSPGAVLLSGGGAVTTDQSGRATFGALSINLAGSGYRLRASIVSAPAAISVVSNPFTVADVFAVGGMGGNAFAPIDCSSTGAVTALKGKYTTYYAPLGALGDTYVWCSNATAAPTGSVLAADSNPTGKWADYGSALTCPTGKVIQSVQAHVPADNKMVTHATITCTLPNGTEPVSVGPSDPLTPVGPLVTAACPAGQVVVGISGRSGLFIDRLELRCGVR
jgi:parallel beta-helix repeat protein